MQEVDQQVAQGSMDLVRSLVADEEMPWRLLRATVKVRSLEAASP